MDKNLLAQQKECLARRSMKESVFSDWTKCTYEVSKEMIESGEMLIREGKVACLILAGGQGSRLGTDVPKGSLQVSAVKQKSLFQLLFEKVFYAGIKYGKKLSIVIMTSSFNHEDTVRFLVEHQWFGLDRGQVHFFKQENLSFFDEKGAVLQKEGPNGNGRCLHLLYQSGLWDLLYKQGVSYLSVVPVDNALADPFDPAFIGFHASQGGEIALKALDAVDKAEKMGRLASESGSLRIVEYSEVREGNYRFANTGLLSFSMDFIRSLAAENKTLPLHAAHKKYGEQFVWKFEYFIFDVFIYAKQVDVLIRPRSCCFSPLKNSSGEDSFFSVMRDLLVKDRKQYKLITGKEIGDEKIELSTACYYLPSGANVFLQAEKLEQGLYITPNL